MLQCDLHNLELWASKWLKSFNINKREVLQISLKNIIEHSYMLHDHSLQKM